MSGHPKLPAGEADPTDRDLAARLTLMALAGMGPARARWLLTGGSASEVIDHLRAGRLPPEVGPAPPGVNGSLVMRWTRQARTVDGRALLAEARDRSAVVLAPGHDRWPFVDDPDPPVVVLASGHVELLARSPTVAIVGTRRCTTVGLEVAGRFGAALGRAGLTVVSGLATGIDGAAHAACLAAGGKAIAVVGSGLDVVYPRANRHLWERLASDGLLLTEAPFGARPQRWRFPARNRLIAALADLVLVVESHESGGSLLTVGEAADRGVPVMAVPGSTLSPASRGTNQLLRDGCAPACEPDDVLDVLGHAPVTAGTPAPASEPAPDPATASAAGSAPAPAVEPSAARSPLAARIRAEVEAGSVHLDQLIGSCRVTIPELLAEIGHLEAAGLVRIDGSTLSLPSGSCLHKE